MLLCSLSLAFSGCAGGHPSAGNIEITAANALLTAGASTQLSATSNSLINGSNDITSKASWSSSNSAVATVTSTGYLTGVSSGTAIITASYEQASGSLAMAIGAPLTTTLTVTPANASVIAGGTQQYKAQAIYANNTAADVSATAQWSVAPSSVGTISSTGLLSVLAPGNFTVTAVSGLKLAAVTGTSAASALASISITPATSSIAGGSTQQFKATATYNNQTTADISSSVTWTSSDTSRLTVNASGLATAIGNSPTSTVQLTAASGSISATVPVTITPGSVVAQLIVEPTSSSIATGSAEQHTATAYYADGTQRDVTSEVTWSTTESSSSTKASSRASHPRDSTVVTIASDGVDYGSAPGTTTLQASLGALQSNTTVIVTPATVTSLSINSTKDLFPVASMQAVQLIGIFSDGSMQDLSLTANWTSSNPLVATISPTGLATGVSPGAVTFGASFGGLSTSTNFSVLPSTLISLTLASRYAADLTGLTQPLQVIGTYSDGSTHDVTSLATFQSADPTVFAVDKAGTAYGVSQGITQISATVGGLTAIQTFASFTDPLTSIQILPVVPRIPLGTQYPFSALAQSTSGIAIDVSYPAVWRSSDPSVLTINGSGVVKTGSAGTATISATVLGVTGVSQTIEVTNAKVVQVLVFKGERDLSPTTIAAGTAQQLNAIAYFDDGSVQLAPQDVTWQVADKNIASIDTNGLVRGTSPGLTQVTASLMGFTSSNSLTVTNATLISTAITPGNIELPIGTYRQFTLTGSFSDGSTQDLTPDAIFQTSSPTIASIVPQGLVLGIEAGVGQITAKYGYFSASTPVNVANISLTGITLAPTPPAPARLRVDRGEFYTAIGTFSDGYTMDLLNNAVFSSSDPDVARVLQDSLALGVSIGTTQVSATYRGITASTSLQVYSNVLSSLQVSPAITNITSGTTQQFNVSGLYADGTSDDLTSLVTWTSSDPSLLSVTPAGLVSALQTLSTTPVTITATYGTSTASFILNVQPVGGGGSTATLSSIVVTPTSSRIAKGTTKQLTATGMYSDGSTADISSQVTWSSPAPSIAIVSDTGLVTGLATGQANVQASVSSLTGSAVVLVSPATLQSLSISPSGAVFAPGANQQFTLTGTFSDGSSQTLTSGVSWSSSNPAVASIDASGLAKGVARGPVQFTGSYGGQSVTSSVATVTSATLVSIAVTPANVSLAKGTNQQFTVIGTYSDGSTMDLTQSSTFSSSNPSVLGITSTGVATAGGVGSAQITVSSGGITYTTQPVNVTPATLSSIAITPMSPSIAAGTMQQFTATGTFSDGSTQDLSSQVVWSSSNPQAITIDQSGNATSSSPGSAQISAAYGGVTGTSGTVTVTPATLTAILVQPSTAQLAKGTTQQLTATGIFTDGTSQNLSTQVTWTSSNGTVVGVDADGLVTATGTGSAQVTAASMGKSGVSSFTVTPATLVSISFTPPNPTVASGTTTTVMVTGTYSDGSMQDLTSSASFVSSNPAVATAGMDGMLAGVAPGTASITVQAGGQTSSFDVTVSAATIVSLAITPNPPNSLAIGTTEQFTATGTFSDGSTQNVSSSAIWLSSNNQVATVTNTGLATGVSLGNVTISAMFEGQSATTPSFAVTPAIVASITVSPQNPSVASGNTQQFTAFATYTNNTSQDVSATVTWSSSNPLVASINTSGLATTLIPGSSTITALLGTLSGTANLTVTAAPAPTLQSIAVTPGSNNSIATGSTEQFTATGTYSDGSTQNLTTQVTWTSSNVAFATINSSGLATGVAAGSVTIQAALNGTSGSAPLTVTTAVAVLQTITVAPGFASVIPTGTQQFTATGHYSDSTTQDLTMQVTWSSSNTLTAMISASGLATGVVPGNVTITAVLNTTTGTASFTVSVPPATLQSIAVTPAGASIVTGATQQYTATGTYSDASTQNLTSQVTWSSSTSAASINSAGLATAVAPGSPTIQATLNGTTGTAGLTVTSAAVTLQSIAVTPASAMIAKSATQQFTATGTYSDASTQNLTSQVTWSSSVPGIATIDPTGLATGQLPGVTQISAALSGQTGTATLTVNPATITSIAVTPATATVADGTTQQYKAVASFSDGSTQDLTNTVSWSSSIPADATINSSGLASTTATGTVTISAQSGGQTGTATLTISNATPNGLQITPSSISGLPAGDFQQLTATATFTDGSSQNVTSSATYYTSDPTVATVNQSGNVSAVGPGSATITATLGGTTATVPVTVSNATLTSITVTPANPTIPAGQSQQLTATGTYSDGSTQDLSSSVNWASSNSAAVSVSSTGNVMVMTPGSATITATRSGVTGSDAITGSNAVVTAISVSPASTNLAVGQTQQFAATATFSDGSQQTVTASAHWSVSDASKASIANGSNAGLLTANAAGSLSAIATIGSVTGSASVTITAATLSSLTINPSAVLSLPAGTTKALTVTAVYSDNSNADVTSQVTWTSGQASTAFVDTTGLLHGIASGITTIDAHLSGVDGTAAVTVGNATLTSIALTPSAPTLPLGQTVQMTATGTYSDNSTADISNQVSWTSAAPATATISSTGLVTPVAPGASTLTAALNGVSGSTTLTVTSATLQTISVTSAQGTFALGQSLPLKATGFYSDGTTQDLTNSVAWTSSAPSVGLVSSTGSATGVSTGTFNARATLNGITGLESLVVTNATLVSIAVTPNGQVIVNVTGSHVQFTATGTFSNGTTQDLTHSVHWGTTGIVVGSISQAGIFTPTGVGAGTVTATSGTITGSASLTVVAVPL